MVEYIVLSRGTHSRAVKFRVVGLSIALFALISCTTTPKNIGNRPAWNDIDVIRENVELPRAHFVAYASREAALSGGDDPYFQSLNGPWKFQFSSTPGDRPAR